MPFSALSPGRRSDQQAKLDALARSNAVIEFAMDGTILDANDNFLSLLGYELAEVRGKHHSMFVDAATRDSAAYQEFWSDLRAGRFRVDQFKRIGKGGREVWIEASYNPILDAKGRPQKVVKYATDVTARRAHLADLEGQVAAIRTSQAVIEFELDGTVIDANDNFLATLGYTIEEIRGRHHRMFVEPSYAATREYEDFWSTLRSGTYLAAQYKRIGKGGREVWIEASYNPILDANGRPCKVVKFATDVTDQVRLLQELKELIDTNFGEIDQAMGRAEQQSGRAASNTRQTAEGVQVVAAGAEEMSASVREISQSMTLSKASADTAHDHVQEAGEATERLLRAAESMCGIVELIEEVAGQINLLALNATIESARAGEAGRGFAVVANEVKELARQAAEATGKITVEIDGVRSVSDEVATALRGIGAAMSEVRESVMTTASAVEEQSAVTQSMAASMNESAASVDQVSVNVDEISAAIQQVKDAVQRTKDAARVLAR